MDSDCLHFLVDIYEQLKFLVNIWPSLAKRGGIPSFLVWCAMLVGKSGRRAKKWPQEGRMEEGNLSRYLVQKSIEIFWCKCFTSCAKKAGWRRGICGAKHRNILVQMFNSWCKIWCNDLATRRLVGGQERESKDRWGFAGIAWVEPVLEEQNDSWSPEMDDD